MFIQQKGGWKAAFLLKEDKQRLSVVQIDNVVFVKLFGFVDFVP